MTLDWKKKTKTFNGKKFKYYIHADNKEIATSTAAWLTSQGKLARITKIENSSASHIVWVR